MMEWQPTQTAHLQRLRGILGRCNPLRSSYI